MTSINFFVTFVVSLVITVMTKQQLFTPAMFTPQFIGTLLYSGIFVTFATYLLFQWAIKHVSTTTAQLKHYIEPVVGVSLNASLLGEHISHGFIAGSLLVFMGITIVTGKHLIAQIKRGLEKFTA
jgi:drug/metabolite transporter (DMT)-like permease